MSRLILDDFTSTETVIWEGNLQRGKGMFPDGRPSAFISGKIATRNIKSNWCGYGSLQFTLYNPGKSILVGGVEIYDRRAMKSHEREYGDYIDRKQSLLIGEGITHVIIRLDVLRTNQGNRKPDLSHIEKLSVHIPEGGKDESPLSISALRLCSEIDKPDEEANALPGDTLLYLKDLDINCYTYKPDAYEDPKKVREMYDEAFRQYNRLEKLVKISEINGKQAYYARAALIAADIAMIGRPMLAWHFSPRAKVRNLKDAIALMQKESQSLQDIISFRTHEDDEDDSNLPLSLVKPIPDLKELRIKGNKVVDEKEHPVLLCAMNYINEGELLRFFAPERHKREVYAAAGGSRYDIEQSPVYAAFKKYDGARRVGWRGWCGHLVKDQWAMGGRKENVVICLESPEILNAIKEYIALHAHEWKNDSELLYIIIGYELSYICYCDESIRRFRVWLEKRHQEISVLNRNWGTAYRDFSEVVPPPTEGMEPVGHANRAAWFDWSDWNMRRFTDHLLWAKDVLQEIRSDIPICAGGTHSMLSPGIGTSGIDEEMIINEVDDVILHEGNDVLGIDLFRALSECDKPLVDPEQGGDCSGWFLNYLHGKSTIAMFWWPKQPSRQFTASTLGAPFQGTMSIKHVAEHFYTALDIRRLTEEIVAFWDIPNEAAILYSRTSMIQIEPKLVTADKTPYLQAFRDSYDAAVCLDTGITFISEKQLLEGKGDGYKVLIIPAASHLPEKVFKAIDEYVCGGGTVLVIPESLTRDEYHHRAAYLERWGIHIISTETPEIQAVGDLEQKYDQNFQRKALSGEGKKIEAAMIQSITGIRRLKISGLYQAVKTDGGTIIAEGPDKEPVLLKINREKGTIWYLCGMPERESLSGVMDEIFEEAGIKRKMKVTDGSGNRIFGLEARLVRRTFDDLVYIANKSEHAAAFHIETDREYCEIREMRSLQYYSHPSGTLEKGKVQLFSLRIDPVKGKH